MGEHGLAQDHTVFKLRGRNAATGGAFAVVASVFACFGIAAKIGMAFGTEPVERAAHIDFFFRFHVEES